MLTLSSITKRFGPTTALDAVDLEVRPGEVHALVGENGAGKSTLMHVAFGMVAPDAGRMTMDGRPVTPGSPREARRLGIGMVHQHFTSVPALTVTENIALAAGWPVHPGRSAARVRELCTLYGLPLDPDALADTLSAASLQRLEILKALAPGARVLLLDEPTGVLAPAEVTELLRVMREFVARGGAVVFISHKLREALAVADRITVLRRGRVRWHGPVAEASEASLAEAIVGPEAAAPIRLPSPAPSAARSVPVLTLANVTVEAGNGQGSGLLDATITLRAGELVGVAAVEGNGARELLRVAAGAVEPTAGSVTRSGPGALVPEDRTTEGLIGGFSLTENVALALADSPAWSRHGLMDWPGGRAATARLIDAFGVRAPGPDTPARALSGGNQQKLVLARALEQRPALLVAENPTRGLDFSATATMQAALRSAAAASLAVLFHSSDLDEVLALADRVLVVSGGRVTEATRPFDRALIGRMMLGAGEPV